MELKFVCGRIDLDHLQDMDAIVCPTDMNFSGSGGLDKAIHQAAGFFLELELKGKHLDEGDVLITGGYHLGINRIAHAAVPKNTDPAVQNPALLNCYRNVLRALGKNDGTNQPIRTAVISLLGTGSCGWSCEKSLAGLWHAILDYHREYQGRGSLEQLVIHYPEDMPLTLLTQYTRRASQAFFDRPMKWDPYLEPGLWYSLMYRFDAPIFSDITLTEFIWEIQRYFYEETGQWLCGDTNVQIPKSYKNHYSSTVTPYFAQIAVPVLCSNLCRLGFTVRRDSMDFILPVTLAGHQLMLPYEMLPELALMRKKGCELTERKRISLDLTNTCFLTTYHYRNAPEVVAYYSLDVEKASDSHYRFSNHTAGLLCAFIHKPVNALGAGLREILKEEGEGYLTSFLKKLGAKAYHYD